MDLLDSIMSKMAKPPSINDKQKKLMREQQKAMDEARNAEREQLSQFRRTMEQRVHTFMLASNTEKLRLEPMEQVARSVVRDVADVAGLTSYTFGVEGEDRHVMLFKKDYALDERELAAYRCGEEWDMERADRLSAQLAEQQRADEFQQRLQEQQRRQALQAQPRGIAGGPKFVEKIDRLVGGRQTGKQAAKSIVCDNNRQFGFVRSELKRDKRTIEETLMDIRAKKQKRELEHQQQQQHLLEDDSVATTTTTATAAAAAAPPRGGGGSDTATDRCHGGGSVATATSISNKSSLSNNVVTAAVTGKEHSKTSGASGGGGGGGGGTSSR